MKEIQNACEDLARYPDDYVAAYARLIADYDRQRDIHHDDERADWLAAEANFLAERNVDKANIRLLKAQLNKANDLTFGQKSEKNRGRDDDAPEAANPSKGGPDLDSGSAKASNAEQAKPRGKNGRQALKIPPHIPEELRLIEPETGNVCSCGECMRFVGIQEIKRLTFVPAQLKVIKEQYKKYACRTCDKIFQARVPKRAFDYTRFDDKLVAGVAVSKFADFTPNYRLEQIFKRSGVHLHRSSMIRMIDNAVVALLPVWEALKADLKSSSKLFMDETTLAMLQPGSGKTKTCYVWALCRDDRRWSGNEAPGVVFQFEKSRKGEHAEQMLEGFNGILQVDGYAGYKRLTREDRGGGPLTLAYCWAHVRRKFLDVHKATKSSKANKALKLINKLFGIEADLRACHQPPTVRLTTRQLESKPLVLKLFKLLREYAAEITMKSALGEAINYTLKLEDGLKVFLNDGRVEMDNNSVENAIRPIALLRKNAMFAGSEVGGRNWAVMASLIGTCRMNGVEPYAYLIWVFERLAEGHPRSRMDELLPWHCPEGRFAIE